MSEDEAVKKIRDRFLKDTKAHEMTVLRDDGLYRHVRFMQPRDFGGSEYWYDLITWPGNLVFRGDGDTYAFAREPDMFGFFRRKKLSINPSYWAEKLTVKCDVAKEYSKDRLIQHVREYLEEGNVDDADLCDDISQDLKSLDENGMLEDLEGARDFLNRWEEDDVWSDTWEWDLMDYDWWFLWALHAIVWGVQQYEARYGVFQGTHDVAQARDVSQTGVLVG